jgi:hypothetical protein
MIDWIFGTLLVLSWSAALFLWRWMARLGRQSQVSLAESTRGEQRMAVLCAEVLQRRDR